MAKEGPIIIVEDDADDHELLKEAFIKLEVDNELRFLNNGQEALDYLTSTKEQPFMILSDINMPVMDGLTLAETINSNDYLKSKSIPFIIFTTTENPLIVNRAYKLSVQGYFKKQNSFDELLQDLKLLVDYWVKCKHPNSA